MSSILSFLHDFGAGLPYILGYLGVLWVAVVFWVAKDISNRTLSVGMQLFSIAFTAFLPLLGLFIYLLVRPEKTLLEKDFEELFYVLREKEIL